MRSLGMTLAIAVLLVTTLVPLASTYPQGFILPLEYNINMCMRDEKVDKLCQTCAQETRGEITYPLCCSGIEDGKTWCEGYLNFRSIYGKK